MPKKTDKKLTPVAIGTKPPGRHPAGEVSGLYLLVTPTGARSWVLRVSVGGKRRDMGLGGWPDVPLAEARTRAREARRKIDDGIDPIQERKAARAELVKLKTFDQCAELLIAAKRPGWKNPKHADQWVNTLATYASPIIGNMPVNAITEADVVRVLSPIWTTKTETATRVRQRVESVLDWAKVAKLRSGDNPARWAGNLEHLLAAPTKVKKSSNFPALPYADLHRFVAQLRNRPRGGASALALEFLILTAARTSEVLNATRNEIDTKAKVWTIPGERMKAGKEHRVPLSPRALALIEAAPVMAGSKLLFPSAKGVAMSDAALGKLIKDMHAADTKAGGAGFLDPKLGRVATAHGMRSTFKDWAMERTAYPGEMSEVALAHTVSDKTEAAYRRGDLMVKRTRMMADWQNFMETPTGTADNVVSIKKSG